MQLFFPPSLLYVYSKNAIDVYIWCAPSTGVFSSFHRADKGSHVSWREGKKHSQVANNVNSLLAFSICWCFAFILLAPVAPTPRCFYFFSAFIPLSGLLKSLGSEGAKLPQSFKSPKYV